MFLHILIWLAAFSFIPCVYLIIQQHRSIKAAHKLHGIVIGYLPTSKQGQSVLHVTYRDENGTTQRIKSRWSSSFLEKAIGDTVIVLDFDDGSQPKLLLFSELFMSHAILLFISIFATVFLFGQNFVEWLYL